MEGIIKNYLIANPEIIRDAINELQRREDQAAQVAQAKAIADNKRPHLHLGPRGASSATPTATSPWSSSSTTTAPTAAAPRPT